MDRELLIEIGVEEVPASWLPSLTTQLTEVTTAQLKAARLDVDGPVESWTTPRRLAVRVRFYRLRFAAHDWLLGKAIGSQISLTYPDGHVERHALKDGKVTIGSLPAGLYRVTVEAPGMASDWPVALSRDKDVDVSIISYLDVALGIFVLALLAVGLLLAGRPALRHRLRRVAA